MTNAPPLTVDELARLRRLGIDPISFGNTLRQKRVASHLTQRQQALALGVDRKTLQEWEKGRVNPTALRFLAWFLDEGENGSLPSTTQFWRFRAQMAEALIKDMRSALADYDQVRRDRPRHPGSP